MFRLLLVHQLFFAIYEEELGKTVLLACNQILCHWHVEMLFFQDTAVVFQVVRLFGTLASIDEIQVLVILLYQVA